MAEGHATTMATPTASGWPLWSPVRCSGMDICVSSWFGRVVHVEYNKEDKKYTRNAQIFKWQQPPIPWSYSCILALLLLEYLNAQIKCDPCLHGPQHHWSHYPLINLSFHFCCYCFVTFLLPLDPACTCFFTSLTHFMNLCLVRGAALQFQANISL